MTDLTPNERIEKIAGFVRSRLQEVARERQDDDLTLNPDYRWQHILRVCNYGKLLAETEGADWELVVAACLLHDVAVFDPGDPKDHGRTGSEVSRPLLDELGYSPEEVENICFSIAAHVDVRNPDSLEAKIVSDADNIDRFGAYRTVLWVLKDLDNYHNLLTNLQARIQTLKKYREESLLETETGNSLFNEQLDFQIAFYEAILKESDWTVLPKV